MDVWTTQTQLPTASTNSATTATAARQIYIPTKEDFLSEYCLHLCLDKGVHLISLTQNLGTININLSASSHQQNQIIQSVITQTLNGDITYGAEDSQLIALFEKFADHLEALKLRSSLDEMKDESSPQEKRQTAAQKIRGFLFKYAPKVGEAAAKVLLEYVGKKIGGMP